MMNGVTAASQNTHRHRANERVSTEGKLGLQISTNHQWMIHLSQVINLTSAHLSLGPREVRGYFLCCCCLVQKAGSDNIIIYNSKNKTKQNASLSLCELLHH